VVGFDLFSRHTAFWRFVLNILDEMTECPDVMPVCV
jgi:hypothetical protein